MEEILEQAYEAYFKSREENCDQPNEGMSTIEDIGDVRYVVLRNVNGILAVFHTCAETPLESILLEEEDWPERYKKE
ncbi:hypothetical protein ES705_13250 [subsurface metagenome]